MKKTLLASAILASLVSVSAQAATVYDADGSTLKISGDVDVTAYSDDSVDGTIGNASYASINLFGTTTISDSVTAYAEFEIDTGSYSTAESKFGADVDGDGEDDSVKTSEFAIDELLVGFDTAYGDFSFGDTSSALGQISDFTDVGNNFAGSQEVIEGEGETGFAYANTFDALTVNAEFKASSEDEEDSIGISAVYSLNGLSVGLGFVTVDEADELAFGLGYSMDALYVGLGYAMGAIDADIDFTSIELAVTYGVTDDVTVMAFYGTGEVEFGSLSADYLDYYALEVEYSIASNVSAYVGYKSNNLDEYSDESDDSDTSIYTQISYDF